MTPRTFKSARRQLGLTAAELARRLRLGRGSDRTVRKWEAGDRRIPGPVAVSLAYMMACADNPTAIDGANNLLQAWEEEKNEDEA